MEGLAMHFATEAGRGAVKIILEKFSAGYKNTGEDEKNDFIFIVNNLTGYELRRVSTVGNNGGWPLSDIEKNKCFAATLHRKEMFVAAQYRAVEARPGVKGITLATAWSNKQGRMGINLFPGKNAEYAKKQLKTGVLDVSEENGNRGLIKEIKGGYIFEFEIHTLGYEQVAVESSQIDANRRVVDLLKSETGKLPAFTFIVNNQTGYDLSPVGDPGSWPLAGHDIRDGECVAGGLDTNRMSFAVQYKACDKSTGSVDKTGEKQLTIALAGSWPTIGGRKVTIFEGKDAQYAWDNLKVCSDYTSPGENRASIIDTEGKLIYSFDITNVDYKNAPVRAGEGASKKAVDLLVDELGRRPGFIFVVNNNTDHNLKRTGSAGTLGGWPLGDLKKKECIAGSLFLNFMSLAVEYSTESGEKISLAGSWPMVGWKKIGIYKGMTAEQAWGVLSGASTHKDGRGNGAEITKEKGSCIYSYDINSI